MNMSAIWGKEMFSSEVFGFESKITIHTGAWKTKTGFAMAGRANITVSNDAELRYFMEYYSPFYNDSSQQFDRGMSNAMTSYAKSDIITYKGRYIEMKLPSSDLGITSINQTIRVLFAERGTGLGEESFLEATGKIYHI